MPAAFNHSAPPRDILWDLLWFMRYGRLALDIFQFYAYWRSKRKSPQLAGDRLRDTTLVAITIGDEPRFLEYLKSWEKAGAHNIVIVTIDDAFSRLKSLVTKHTTSTVLLRSVPHPNYRKQLCVALEMISTEFFVKVDDRVTWGDQSLRMMLAAFNDTNVGGVNTLQEVVPQDGSRSSFTPWEWCGALNLIRRNFLHSFVAYINNGQVLNLSGRTAAFRTRIFQNEDFYHCFQTDVWGTTTVLRTGDDNFMTNWILHRGWRTAFIHDKRAQVLCRVNGDSTYLRQVRRWSRDTARYYLRDMMFTMRHPSLTHIVRCILNCVSNYCSDIALLIEMAILVITSLQVFWVESGGMSRSGPSLQFMCMEHVAAAIFLTVFEHGLVHGVTLQVQYLPVTVAYAYAHAFIVLQSIFSLNQSSWDSRSSPMV